MAARRWVVRGRVQGVGFRNFVKREAERLGVRGWVRNLDDGTVEAWARGTRAELDLLQGRLWEGPRWSEVRGVDPMEAAEETARAGFHIL
jgi:acylphosphatase